MQLSLLHKFNISFKDVTCECDVLFILYLITQDHFQNMLLCKLYAMTQTCECGSAICSVSE